MQIMVGSQAARIHFPDFREPDDVDYFSDTLRPGRELGQRIEVFYQPMLLNYFGADEHRLATPDELYTIKVSHAFWRLRNNTWEKHMADIVFFQEKGCQLIEPLYNVLYAIWEERYGKKRANLNVSAEEFFTPTVVRKYDHDSIHRSVAYGDKPLYESILRDGADVAVSKSKFFELERQDQLRLVREEVYATALERILIPRDYRANQEHAYAWALRQTITSFSKGWFPLWVVCNYRDLRRPDCDFVARHHDKSHLLIELKEGECLASR